VAALAGASAIPVSVANIMAETTMMLEIFFNNFVPFIGLADLHYFYLQNPVLGLVKREK